MDSDLAPEDAAVLDMAGQTWPHRGAYHAQIRERFGQTPTQFFRRLNQLLDDPAAAAAAPLVVNRLRRLRDSSLRVRLALHGHHATIPESR